MFVRVFVVLAFAVAAAAAAALAYAFVDHAVDAFANGGAFLAVVAAPLPPTTPFAVGITEAARLMGISRALVYSLVAAGELEVVKIGTRTVVRTDVIQRFLAANAGVPDPNLSPLKRAERKAAAPAATPAPITAAQAERHIEAINP